MTDEQLTTGNEEVERDFADFWAEIVCPGGVWDLQQVKRELSDFHAVMHEAGKAYDTLTGGRISKVNTLAVHVISAVNENFERLAKEDREDRQALIERIKDVRPDPDTMGRER